MKYFQHTKTTTQAISKLNLDPFQKSFHATHTSLTLNTDLTPIGLKPYMIKTNWSTRILITKPNDLIESDDLITHALVSDAL